MQDTYAALYMRASFAIRAFNCFCTYEVKDPDPPPYLFAPKLQQTKINRSSLHSFLGEDQHILGATRGDPHKAAAAVGGRFQGRGDV